LTAAGEEKIGAPVSKRQRSKDRAARHGGRREDTGTCLEAPGFIPGGGVEGVHVVVERSEVDPSVDHCRRGLLSTGTECEGPLLDAGSSIERVEGVVVGSEKNHPGSYRWRGTQQTTHRETP
jgi:hypothetical protein